MKKHTICQLEKRLITARDIACARASCLGIASDQSFCEVTGGLPTLLVSVLSDAFQSWCKLYQDVTEKRGEGADLLVSERTTTETELGSVTKYTKHFHTSEEVKTLHRVLKLIAKISELDSIFSEEISRAGSQAILFRLIEQIEVCVFFIESNGSCEEDFDALMDLQDTAFEIYFPEIRGAMAFTDDELSSRLPLVYNLRPATSNAQSVDSTTVLIHQVTKRQTAQADVGFLMWPSAIILARWLLSNKQTLKGKTILEIGAGCGLTGILAAALLKDSEKPSRVIISDVNNTVLENISRNISLNNVSSIASVAKLDFYQQTGNNDSGKWLAGEFDCNNERYCEPVDIVLAADIICQPEDAVAAAKTIYDALIPGGVAFVVCANEKHRFGIGKFAGECEASNLQVTTTKVEDLYDGNLLTDSMDSAAGWESGMTLTFFTVTKGTIK